MTPLHLSLRNFLSYREPAELDFSQVRIACLAGDNGAGKSALLDAMTWAVWGKTRTNNDREVISIGASEMEVTFTFALGEREYRVFRRRSYARSASGTQSLEFFVRAPGDVEWLPITGDNVRDTQARIVATLNMDYVTFTNSAFILQGKADSFTNQLPSDRKKILGEILELGEYDELQKLAREDEKRVKGRIDELRGRMEVLDEQLAERPRLIDDLEVTGSELTAIGERLDLAQELARELALRLTAQAQVRELYAAAQKRAAGEQASLDQLDREFQREARRRDELLALVTHAEEIEHGAAEHVRWRAAAARFAGVLRDVQTQTAIVTDATREIDAERNRLQRERDRQLQVQRAASERLAVIEREEARLHELRREQEQTWGDVTRLDAVRLRIEELREERLKLHAANSQLKQRSDEMNDSLQRLGDAAAECPVCQQPLSIDHRTQLQQRWESEREIMRDQWRENQRVMKAIETEERERGDELKRLEALARDHAARDGMIRQLEGSLTDRAQHEQARAACEREIVTLDTLLTTEDYAHAARRRLADAQVALVALAYDADAHHEAEQREREFAPFEARKRQLDDARATLGGVEQALAMIERQRAEREAARAEALAEVAALAGQLAADPELPRRAAAAKADAEELERERNELAARQRSTEQRLEQLDKLDREREVAEKETAELALDQAALRELSEAFGRNGIQAMIVENVLPELEDETNRLLEKMASTQLRVQFRSQKQALSNADNIIETLDIVIRDEAGERPYQLYSGGESFRINFAVRVALSKLLARRAGASVEMLVIDEGFGTQDARGREGLIEALHSVENDFRTIIAITHIDDIRDHFPTRIDIVKTERGSQIAVG